MPAAGQLQERRSKEHALVIGVGGDEQHSRPLVVDGDGLLQRGHHGLHELHPPVPEGGVVHHQGADEERDEDAQQPVDINAEAQVHFIDGGRGEEQEELPYRDVGEELGEKHLEGCCVEGVPHEHECAHGRQHDILRFLPPSGLFILCGLFFIQSQLVEDGIVQGMNQESRPKGQERGGKAHGRHKRKGVLENIDRLTRILE
mmetsp:Transcript_42095/g.134477  ORF Transcript_42095/g.134477 Transcript_42095/m.134477 type:complete len:202 (-) Transcript_42095:15-620(-)